MVSDFYFFFFAAFFFLAAMLLTPDPVVWLFWFLFGKIVSRVGAESDCLSEKKRPLANYFFQHANFIFVGKEF